jgi:hypothetical protein
MTAGRRLTTGANKQQAFGSWRMCIYSQSPVVSNQSSVDMQTVVSLLF